MNPRIAIIGAGPIGLEAGLAATQRGHDVTVYEKGCIADSVRRWGHIRMFSPFVMNASAQGLGLLRGQGLPLPADDACLTGNEFVAAYLEPLARHLNVCLQTRVKAIVREHSGKRDKIGEPGRAETPFRLLIESNGAERHAHADVILDCSGTFQNPNPLGNGGIPALGEGTARELIRYGIGEASHIEAFTGRRVLVAGGGHSAANLIAALVELKKREPATDIHWMVRKPGSTPCIRMPDDPLAERDRISAAANAAAAAGEVTLHDGTTLMEVRKADQHLELVLQCNEGFQILQVDHIVAATGYRPDWSFARELHIQTCWATEGTYPLAASLLGETGGDCLAVPVFGADTLVHPEPDFYALGMKSYGRTPDFLISTGLRQVEALMDRLEHAWPQTR
ncbi:MAG: putative bacillithiol system oxidoreductase, YpdA family [Verrucomicrobiaceae bacterium]|nr:putative bacillithiol system oxidoreductase, YpdA family [Verrucomicrobiaceae bacterium]